jgi:hypothetical protein
MSSAAEDLAARLDRIRRLTEEYLRVKRQSNEARKLAERIRQEVDAAHAHLARPTTRK